MHFKPANYVQYTINILSMMLFKSSLLFATVPEHLMLDIKQGLSGCK